MKKPHKNLAMIYATTEDGLMGVDGKLPWYCPEDLKFFKETTLGKTVVMGRKTWDSLPFKKGLPGRKNIVISKTVKELDGATVYGSVDAFVTMLAINTSDEKFIVIGGKEVYEQLEEYCSEVYHTVIPKQLVISRSCGDEVFYKRKDVGRLRSSYTTIPLAAGDHISIHHEVVKDE